MITATYKGKYYDVEYSVVNVSELEGELRIDAEYYDPFYLKQFSLFRNIKRIGELKEDIRYGLYIEPNYIDKGINFIRALNLLNFWIEGEIVKIPSEKISKNYLLQTDDIIIVRSGANTGSACIVDPYFNGATFGSYIIRVRLNKDLINPYYLTTFLNSKYGLLQSIRFKTGSSQLNLNIPNIESLKIPIPSNTFQKFIEKLILKAYEERKKAEKLYKQAEGILLEELELKNWKPKTKKIKIGGKEFEEEENISIRTLSEVVKADRMDAEYWEPKYIEFEEVIRSYKKGYDYLPNLIKISKETINIDLNDIYNYIELADINPNLGVVNQTSQIIGKKLPTRARMKVKRDYIIMSSVEGSIDKIALIDFDKENLVASTGFFVFKEKVLNKETILVLLKLLAEKYLRREAQGTILTAIPYNSLKRIILPKVDENIQIQISQLIQQSLKARENSKKLLEVAKKAVEIAIEKNEKEALEYMKQETNYSDITVVN
jgi:restriction endonuclease S subunit